MKRKLAALFGVALGVSLTASASITITIDELGNGLWVDGSGTKTFTGISGLDPNGVPVVKYNFNTNFVAGDVILTDPDGTTSDVIRIPSLFPGFGQGIEIWFYCSDTGLPITPSPGQSVNVPETMAAGGQTGASYHLQPDDYSKPGYFSGSQEQPYFNFLSDIEIIPEPGTVLAGALLLLPFGANARRMLRKRR